MAGDEVAAPEVSTEFFLILPVMIAVWNTL